MSIKDSSFYSELNVAKFWIVDEFGIDSRSTAQGCVPDFLDHFPSVASSEDVGQQQSCSFVLFLLFKKLNLVTRSVEVNRNPYFAIAENVEDDW